MSQPAAPAARFLCRGLWHAAQLSSRLVPSTFVPDAPTTALVDAAWAEQKARLGERLFDGPLCRLEACRASVDGLHLDLSRCSYRWFLGTNGSHAESCRDRGMLADCVGTSAALLSCDGWLVFGRRSEHVALYPGWAHPFGGCLEPADTIDLIGEIARELSEEIGLKSADITSLSCLGIGIDYRILQPELLYLAHVIHSRDALGGMLTGDEHTGSWAVRATVADIDRELRQPELLTPVTLLVLLRYREVLTGSVAD